VRLGIGVSENIPIAEQQRIAAHVESAGFASLWANEARGRDALLLCQAWAAATTDLEVGVGVVSLWTRTPAQLAMGTATLQEATGGRFLLGIGVSHPLTMGPHHGVEVRRPMSATRELVDILAQLDAGEKSDVAGRVFTSQGFRLELTPKPPPMRVYLAAMGPQMLQLAGERGDGALLNWSGPEEVARAGGIIRDAARDAGRDPAEVDVATYVRVAVADNRDDAKAALAVQAGRYASLTAYADHMRRQGLGDAVERVTAARTAGADGYGLAEALGDEALDVLGWTAVPGDDPATMVQSYRDAGLDHLVVRVVVVGDDAVDNVTRVVRTFDTTAGA